MKIFIALIKNEDSYTFLTKENLAILESLGELVWNETGRGLTPEELRDALVDVDICVTGWGTPRFTAEVLEKANKLKLIAHVCGSVSPLVSDAMYEKGVRIVCGNEAFAISVAEGAMAHILSGQRRLTASDCRVLEKGWRYTNADFSAQSLLGKTVGIVGYGAISRYLLTMLKPFHVNIKLFSKHTTEEQAAELGVQKADLDEIFSTCDIVSLHCARSDENYHLINDRLLSMMKPNALLVNTSRGDVTDELAVAKHVKEGHIRASIDVYEVEPLKADHPFRELGDRICLQAHSAGPTIDYRYAAARLVVDDAKRLVEGKPLQNEILPWRAKMMTK